MTVEDSNEDSIEGTPKQNESGNNCVSLDAEDLETVNRYIDLKEQVEHYRAIYENGFKTLQNREQEIVELLKTKYPGAKTFEHKTEDENGFSWLDLVVLSKVSDEGLRLCVDRTSHRYSKEEKLRRIFETVIDRHEENQNQQEK
ncbi:hypothetical protein H6F51_21440 [Cyanobacteria bacterium FACHB-DQ100]|nr:hypothetical protein [Cyanobacteria bacterium FACHB-DQ100]